MTTTETKQTSGIAGHFISAPWRSSGKTMLSMGLARAANRRSLCVQTFKKGPDYIDPLWLKSASFNPCYNLDPYLQTPEELRHVFVEHMAQRNAVLVEGTMGLHDGLAEDGSDSNAAIAKQLGLPVLLVIDCRGMHRTIAALINGIQQFDPALVFSGIVLNRIRSDRHASKIQRAIAAHSDIDVLGVIPDSPELRIDERELGLVPAPDHPFADAYIGTVADILEKSCNLDTLFTPNIPSIELPSNPQALPPRAPSSLRIGIARDEAFHFYYEDDLQHLQSRGVELVEISPLRDTFPTDLDGLLIGGGFPERHAAELSKNQAFRRDLAEAIANGLPVRAECGGLMYLCQSIAVENVVWSMVGAIDGVVTMQTSPQGRGYMKLGYNDTNTSTKRSAATLAAHEFHHSNIQFEGDVEFAYLVERGHGVDGKHDGVCVQNVVASYAHFRHGAATPWVDWFLNTIAEAKTEPQKRISHV